MSGSDGERGRLEPSEPAHLRHVVERLHCGVVVTAADDRPVFVNAFARQVLKRRDGLAVSTRGLEASRPQDTKLLRDAIARATRGELTGTATIVVARTAVPRPLLVHVPVLPAGAAPSGCATVLIADPSIQPAIDADALCRLYALTRAESALAVLLARGRTLEEAAELTFTSIHTVRTHLKRILLKTETTRQTDLVRLVLLTGMVLKVE